MDKGAWIRVHQSEGWKMRLQNSFFDRDPSVVAKDLLGKILYVNHNKVWLSDLIIETEAYYIHE